MPISKREVLLARLLLSNAQYHIQYHRYYSNHLSHGLIALYFLGASSERLLHWYEHYTERLIPANIIGQQTITEKNWKEFVGEKMFYRDYLSFFQDQEKKYGLRRVIEMYVPNLMKGFASSAFHPLIQMGFGLQLLQFWKQQKWIDVQLPESLESTKIAFVPPSSQESDEEISKLMDDLPEMSLLMPEILKLGLSKSIDTEVIQQAAVFTVLQGLAYLAFSYTPMGNLIPVDATLPSASSRGITTSSNVMAPPTEKMGKLSLAGVSAGASQQQKQATSSKKLPLELLRDIATNETFGPGGEINVPRDQLFTWRLLYLVNFFGDKIFPRYDTLLSSDCTTQDMLDAAAVLYCESNDDFFMLHCVTGSYAFKNLEPWLPKEICYDAKRILFRCIAAVYITRMLDNDAAKNVTPINWSNMEKKKKDWKVIIDDAASKFLDEHPIKVVFVSNQEYCCEPQQAEYRKPMPSPPTSAHQKEAEMVRTNLHMKKELFHRIAEIQTGNLDASKSYS